MKAMRCIILSCVLGLGLISPVRANIYGYTAEDGQVFLSNVPADKRYTVLIRVTGEPAAGTPAAEAGKLLSSLARKGRFNRMVDEIARTYGLESALLHAVISVESSYSPNAISKKGAMGLMQLMPSTAKRYGVADPLDPVQNVHGGAKYLRDLLAMFNSDLHLVLAAYNAGENAVIRNGYRIPPFRETTNYVPRVLGFYRKYQSSL